MNEALTLNNIGRWEIDGDEFTSGEAMEIKLNEYWIRGRVECVGHPKPRYVLMAGSTVINLHNGLIARRPPQRRM